MDVNRNIIWSTFSLTIALFGCLSANDTLHIDLEKAQVNWIGRKITGEHTGNIQLFNGWVIMEKNVIKGGIFTFDMTSISNTDIESPQWKRKLEDHLKAEDFFYVDSFPHAILEIKGEKPLSKDDSTSNKQILADLTIRGFVHEINFPFTLNKTPNYFAAEGKIDIDRTNYNIQYRSSKFVEGLGDKLIYDNFTVQFMVQTPTIPQ